jgi:RNA polymerase sigma factor (sigma-70 family)
MSQKTSSAEGQIQVNADDDVSLILRMADKHLDPDDAEAALVIFFNRHHRLLKGFAEKNNYRSLGFDPDDFVLRAFQKAYERAGSFDAPAGLLPERLEKRVRCWIFEIAKNEFLMELRKGLNKSEETADPDLLPPPNREDECEEESTLTGKAAMVRTFLDGLADGDRQLMETSMNFYDHVAKKVVIPSDILEGLARALGTTPEGIKQRRKRLLQRLKQYVEKA